VAAAAVAGAIDAGFSAGCASGLDVCQTVSGASNLVVSIDTARHASEFQPPRWERARLLMHRLLRRK
jgi:hypothetical protein